MNGIFQFIKIYLHPLISPNNKFPIADNMTSIAYFQ